MFFSRNIEKKISDLLKLINAQYQIRTHRPDFFLKRINKHVRLFDTQDCVLFKNKRQQNRVLDYYPPTTLFVLGPFYGSVLGMLKPKSSTAI